MSTKLTTNTTLKELEALGVTALGDIPLYEFLEMAKNESLSVAKDLIDEDPNWSDKFTETANHIQAAIEVMPVKRME